MENQDFYLDFELMKRVIEKLGKKETFTKTSLVEIIKREYNAKSLDIGDNYVYLKLRHKPRLVRRK